MFWWILLGIGLWHSHLTSSPGRPHHQGDKGGSAGPNATQQTRLRGGTWTCSRPRLDTRGNKTSWDIVSICSYHDTLHSKRAEMKNRWIFVLMRRWWVFFLGLRSLHVFITLRIPGVFRSLGRSLALTQVTHLEKSIFTEEVQRLLVQRTSSQSRPGDWSLRLPHLQHIISIIYRTGQDPYLAPHHKYEQNCR